MKLLAFLICSTLALSTAWADKDPGKDDQPPTKEQKQEQRKDQGQDQDQGRWQDGDQDQDGGYDRPVPREPAFFLNGTWRLIQQSCSSGAPVRSGFIFGRDMLELNFADYDFTARSEMASCSSWSSGPYDMSQNVLRMTVNRARSSCGPGDPLVTFSYPIRVYNNDQFGITMGPLNGGPCPYGDILENVFERAF